MASNKKSWTRHETDDLIARYKNSAELWNVTCEAYRNRKKKTDVLKNLAKHFGTNVDEVTRKIHNLRNQFQSEMKKTKVVIGDEGEDQIEYEGKWSYFYPLLFLRDVVQFRTITGNFKDYPPFKNEGTDMYTSLEKITPNSDNSPRNDPGTQPKKKKIADTPYSTQPQPPEAIYKAPSTLNQDEYDIFGKYVASRMRTLNFPSLKRKMERQITQIILNILEEEDDMIASHSETIFTTYPSIQSSNSPSPIQSLE